MCVYVYKYMIDWVAILGYATDLKEENSEFKPAVLR